MHGFHAPKKCLQLNGNLHSYESTQETWAGGNIFEWKEQYLAKQ